MPVQYIQYMGQSEYYQENAWQNNSICNSQTEWKFNNQLYSGTSTDMRDS